MGREHQEYSKISIHNHFGGDSADCTIDKIIGMSPSFDLAQGFGSVDEAAANDFDLLVQTNSNCLDAAAFLLMRRYAKQRRIELLPGVEVNLKNWDRESRILHVVLVFSPASNVYALQESLRGACQENGKYVIRLDQLCELLVGTRAVVCAHGIKQGARSIGENPEMAREIIGLGKYLPVAFEDNRKFHQDVLKERIKDFLSAEDLEWFDSTAADLSAVDRGSFSDIISPTYIWAGNTFDDLYYSLLMGGGRVVRQVDIVRRVSYVSRVVVDGGGGMLPSTFDCSQGLNCVIGPSGSGKTLLLDIIKNKLKGEHLSVDTSSNGCYDDLYDLAHVHLYGPDGKELDKSDGFEIVEGENLYNRVIKAYSGEFEELVEELGLSVDAGGYYQLMNNFEDAANAYLGEMADIETLRKRVSSSLTQAQSAARFVTLNNVALDDTVPYMYDSSLAGRVDSLGKVLDRCKEDESNAMNSFDVLSEIANRNGFPKEMVERLNGLRADFFARLAMKRSDTDKALINIRLVRLKQSLIYASCQSYNKLVSGQFQQLIEKKQVLSDKLQDVAKALLDCRKAEYLLEAPSLDEDTLRSSLKLKSENPAAELEINGLNLVIGKADDLWDMFPKNTNRQRSGKGKANAQSFSYPYDLGDSASVSALLEVFASAGITGGLTVSLDQDKVIDSTVKLKNENGVFMPLSSFSAGMLGKVYVEHFLDAAIADAGSSTMILYDQPESNMEKEFLLTVLGGKFAELRKTHQIFVATHEPLLVVNADANEIILASNDKKVDQPNCVRYENRSFVGAHGKVELIEEVARLIDGGRIAVARRSGIYEGMA